KKQAALWQVANVKSMLGEALLGQNKPAEARPLLVAGYEGLKEDEKAIPEIVHAERITEAIQRLIGLAAATNRPDDVKRWQAELANYGVRKPLKTPDKKLLGAKVEIGGTTVNGAALDWPAYRGKVVLVGFWTTDSPDCRLEIANAKKLYQLYHDRGFDVIGIGLDRDKQKLSRYLDKEPLPWTTLYTRDSKGNDPTAARYGIEEVPAGLLLDRGGNAIALAAQADELAELLEKLLGPPYRPKGRLTLVDLQSKANASDQYNELSDLPKGEREFLGVKFRVGELRVQLRGENDNQQPERVLLPIDRAVENIYVLHGSK